MKTNSIDSLIYVQQGAYGLAEAAGLAHVFTETASRWFVGREGERGGAAFLRPSLPDVDGRHAVSFLDLVDLLVVGRLRELGLSLQAIRRSYETLRARFDTLHPFSHCDLRTDGASLFLHEAQDARPRLEHVVTGQRIFETLAPHLDTLDYNGVSKIAERWRIAAGVVVDPRRNFGKPVVETSGVATYVLWSAFAANGRDAELVADLFNVSPTDVQRAVSFEEALRGHHAA